MYSLQSRSGGSTSPLAMPLFSHVSVHTTISGGTGVSTRLQLIKCCDNGLILGILYGGCLVVFLKNLLIYTPGNSFGLFTVLGSFVKCRYSIKKIVHISL